MGSIRLLMGSLLVALMAVLGTLLVTPSMAAALQSAGRAQTCAYNVHVHPSAAALSTSERGPPRAVGTRTTGNAIDHWSHGISARRALLTTTQTTYAYNHPCRLCGAQLV